MEQWVKPKEVEAVALWHTAYARAVKLVIRCMGDGSHCPTASMPAYVSVFSDAIYFAIPSIDRVASAMSAIRYARHTHDTHMPIANTGKGASYLWLLDIATCLTA